MQSLNNREYLEKLLRFACGNKCETDAAKISEAFASGADIASTGAHVLQNLSGCTEQTADFIRLVAALTSRRITDNFKIGKKYSISEIERYVCALLFHLEVESVYMLSFDKNGKLLSADIITEGTVNSSPFLPRKMADIALRRKAASVILAHNHPSGNLTASDNDVSVTLLAESVLRDANVRLDAHYITVGFDIFDCLKEIKRTCSAN